ncbi:MAG TPA: sortase [Candidatus Cryosericum sp.]|nr:sortase [Candidatus Cryosericum sp.]
MAFGKNALPTRKREEHTELTVTPSGKKHKHRSKAQQEMRAIRALGLAAIILGLVALTLIAVKLFEGEEADKNAAVLLEAYKAQATVTPSTTATVSPAPTQTAEATDDLGTPQPEDANLEQTNPDADASAAADANEHMANDGSNAGVDETGEYVQPDAPEVSELDMTIQKIIKATDENGVIGILEIPKYDVELPIIGKWSYKLLKISICRYKGPDPNEKGNLVIIGHNYKSGAHFGILKKLEVGDEVFLTDSATGTRVRYEVYQIKSIAPDAFSALKTYQGDYGLTLMTCKDNGTNRLLVRCEKKAAG